MIPESVARSLLTPEALGMYGLGAGTAAGQLGRFLEPLDYPRRFLTQLGGALTGNDEVAETGDFSSPLLRSLGMDPAESWAGAAGKLGLDMATDPLTYLLPGVGGLGGRAAGRVGAKAVAGADRLADLDRLVAREAAAAEPFSDRIDAMLEARRVAEPIGRAEESAVGRRISAEQVQQQIYDQIARRQEDSYAAAQLLRDEGRAAESDAHLLQAHRLDALARAVGDVVPMPVQQATVHDIGKPGLTFQGPTIGGQNRVIRSGPFPYQGEHWFEPASAFQTAGPDQFAHFFPGLLPPPEGFQGLMKAAGVSPNRLVSNVPLDITERLPGEIERLRGMDLNTRLAERTQREAMAESNPLAKLFYDAYLKPAGPPSARQAGLGGIAEAGLPSYPQPTPPVSGLGSVSDRLLAGPRLPPPPGPPVDQRLLTGAGSMTRGDWPAWLKQAIYDQEMGYAADPTIFRRATGLPPGLDNRSLRQSLGLG